MKIVNFEQFNESIQEINDKSFLDAIENQPELDDDSRNIIKNALELLNNEQDPLSKSEHVEDILLQIGDSIDTDFYKKVETWLKNK